MPYLILAGMLIFSIADIKYRVIPAIEVVFFGVVLLVVRDRDLLHVGIVVLSVLSGVLPRVPKILSMALLFFPYAWPTLLFGVGVRNTIVGRADLYAVGIVSLLFTQDIVIASIIVAWLWIKWWGRKWSQRAVPLVPGMSLGVLIGLATRWAIAFAGGGS
jgi:hypothetical protein